MTLNSRLSACAEFVTGQGKVCDVGTDHGLLAVYLAEKGLQVIASDIADGPLQATKSTVEKSSFSDNVTIVKSDGLKAINQDGISDIVIAGMGGETIASILGSCEWLGGVNLVLQPMSKAPFLRKWLFENGFNIVNEKAVLSDGYYYTVINAEYTGTAKNVSGLYAQLGALYTIAKKDIVTREYMLKTARSLVQSAQGLLQTTNGIATAEEKLRLAREIVRGQNDSKRSV